MQAFMLAKYFRRVEMSKSESAVLQAIISKANIYGKKAKVSIGTLAAITGYCKRTIYRAIRAMKGRLLHYDPQKIRWNYNTINVYYVIVPWRYDPEADPASLPWYAKKNKRGDMRCHPNPEREKTLATPCTEEEASARWTRGCLQWYWAQGLEPPHEETPHA